MYPSKKLNINASNSKQATCKLFVGNLATHTTSAHLQSIFHSYGQVIECVKVRERYGFVRFSSNEEAQYALNACNGVQLNGYPMIVEYAQNEILISPKSPRNISYRSQTSKSVSSTLNPDASSFAYPCSSSDYYSQSDRPSSSSSSVRSNCLSPSILSATLPLSYSDNEDDDDYYRKNINDKRQSLNIFIGDKILSLYGSNTDTNNNTNTNNQTSVQFNGKI
jgi:RNA recognition motif-containing protein